MARKDKDEMTIEERREYRKKRRIRNQILAYLSLVLLLVCIGIGGFYGVKFLINKVSGIVSQGNDVPTVSDDSVSQDQFVMSSDGMGAGVISTPEEIVEPEVTEPEVVECEEARNYINAMSLEDKVAAMFIVSPEDVTEVDRVTAAGEQVKAAVDEYGMGGIIFTDNNITSAEQFAEMLSTAQGYYQTTYNNTMWLAYNGASAADYKDSGINMTITTADSFALGSSGVLDCVTLFPFPDGVGADSLDESIDDMRETRFAAFNTAVNSGADAIILSNAKLTAVEDLPASLSYAVITETLRNDMGFDGVIITGFMDEDAITGNYSAGEAALKAVNAGADIILCSDDFYAAYDEVLTAVQSGEIPESRIDESLMRIYTAKYQ